MLRVFALALAIGVSAGYASAYEIEPAAPDSAARAAVLSPAIRTGETGGERLAEPASERMLTPGEAVTVTVDTADGPVLRSRFDGIAEGSAPLVRVFVGKPDATADTSIDDPHYAGTVAFYPIPLDGTFTATQNLSSLLERTELSGEVPVTYLLMQQAGSEGSGVVLADAALGPAP